MKKLITLFIVVLFLIVPVFCLAGEKEELLLKKEMLTERRDKLVTQNQLIQLYFQANQNELAGIEEKIKEFDRKETEKKAAEKKKAEASKPEEKKK